MEIQELVDTLEGRRVGNDACRRNGCSSRRRKLG